MELLELLTYVNKGLEDGKSVTGIGKELGLNESSIRKKLTKNGYKREGNKFVLNTEITNNITTGIATEITNNITEVKQEPKAIISNYELNIDMDKLNLLLNNLDSLLKLVPNTEITNNITYRDGDSRNISLRCDSGLYEAIKERSKNSNVTISEIVNRALEDYLNRYLL